MTVSYRSPRTLAVVSDPDRVSYRGLAATGWYSDPAQVSYKGLNATAWYADAAQVSYKGLNATGWYQEPPGATMRQIVGYAFTTPLPSAVLRNIAGYAFQKVTLGIPVTKTGDLLLYDMINNARSVTTPTFSSTNTTLGVPAALAQVDDQGRNTRVQLTAKQASGYSGKMWFYYTRRDMGGLSLTGSNYTGPVGGSTILNQISAINTAFGTNFTSADLVDGPIAAGAKGIILKAAATSYVYLPGTQAFAGPTSTLAGVLTKTKMSGWDGYNPDGTVNKPLSYSDIILQDAPYAYYKLQEASGTVVTDSSGNNRNGTYVGSPTFNAATLRPNASAKSITLPGAVGSYLDISAANAFADSGAWSFEVWVNLAAYNNAGIGTRFTGAGLLSNTGSTDPATGLDLNIANTWDNTANFNALGYWPADNAQANSGTGTSPGLSAVSHIVFTFSAGTMSFYLNGTLIKTLTGITAPTKRAALYAARQAWIGGTFQGAMGDIALYSTALSAARVQAHYNAR